MNNEVDGSLVIAALKLMCIEAVESVRGNKEGTFSSPRRVWNDPPASSPPKAPLRPLVFDCINIPVIRISDRAI